MWFVVDIQFVRIVLFLFTANSHHTYQNFGKDVNQSPLSELQAISGSQQQGWRFENPYQTLGSISESSGYPHFSASHANMENTDLASLPAASDYEYLPAITLHTSAQELRLHASDSMVTTSRNKRSGGGLTMTRRVRDLDFPRESRRRSFDHTASGISSGEAGKELVDGRRRASVPSHIGCVPLTLHKRGKNFVYCRRVGKLSLNGEIYFYFDRGFQGFFL